MNRATRILIWAFFYILLGIMTALIGEHYFEKAAIWYEYILPSLTIIIGFWYFVEGLSMGRKSIKMD